MGNQLEEAIWGKYRVQFFSYPPDPNPTYETDAVLVFVFHDDQFVLTNITNRGWTIPGGRIDRNETFECTAKREAYEETGARIEALFHLGFYLFTNLADESESIRMVPVYIAHADLLEPLPVGFESTGVMHATLNQLPRIYYIWDPLVETVCNYAYSRALFLGWCS